MYGKKTYKKYPKKTYKKGKSTSRKYKTMFKSNYGQTKVRAPVNSRETYVTLPFLRTFQPTIAAATAQTYAVLGNSLIPMPSAYNSSIAVGDTWCSGVSEYASFYSKYRVLASKVSIQVTAVSANNVFRVVLIPVMYGGIENGSSGTVAQRITELDALTYDQIAQQPFAQAKTLGIATGGNATLYMKTFRKTKHMLGCKDIKDNNSIIFNLPDPDGTDGSISCEANTSFFYYLRIFNTAGASTQTVEVQIKARYYTQLSGRTNWVPIAVPS